ncbi:MAG: VCBS repeat-containing protein, partial [Clostridiaceae bacterium]|nr:VCBS repeat-containing protein [Clostridiaceae bacterium]
MEQSGIGKWKTQGFEGFASGTFGNGGQNLFVSAAGVLQRIFQYDVNNDGWPDLLFANSQSMFERPPLHLYEFLPELQAVPDGGQPVPGGEQPVLGEGQELRRLRTDQRGELAANGCQTAILADLSGNGYKDLIIASRHNGTHSDNSSMIYYGSATGFSERYRVELPTSTAYDVAAGDFNGDGRLDLVFACETGLMLFYQTPLGIDGAARVDLDLQVTSVAAADLDGDGYDDLYIKLADGRAAVMWGGNGGLCAERMTFLPVQADEAALGVVGTASTAGRAMLEQWRCEILELASSAAGEFTGTAGRTAGDAVARNGAGRTAGDAAARRLLFAVDGADVVLFACSEEREFGERLRLNCPEAQCAALVDLNADGVPELIVATSAERNDPGVTFIFWGEAASAAEAEPTALPKYGYDAVTRLITKGACYVRGITLRAGDTCLAITQNSSAVNHTSNVHLLGFNADRSLLWRQAVPGGSPLRVLYDERLEQLIIPNREFNPKQGIEQIYIYLGGEDGYVPDRYLGLPGLSAVEGHIVDFNDDGRPDVIVVNCCEDAAYKDRGCYIFYNREREADGTESSGAEHEDSVADEPDGTIVLEHAAYPPCTSEADLRSTYEGFDFHPSTISPA